MNPLDFLSGFNPQSWAIKAILILVASLSTIFGLRMVYLHIEDGGYQKAQSEFVSQSLRDMGSARTKEQWLQEKINEANNERTKQEQALSIIVSGNLERTNQLRQQLDTANRNLSKYSSAALIERVNTVSDVFEQCTVAYADVAEKADRHAADVQLMVNSWPKP